MKALLVAVAVISALPVAQGDSLLSDEFNYPDGPLQSGSSGTWQSYSGDSGAIDVQSGQVFLTESENEDIRRLLTGAPILVSSPAVLYSGFQAMFTALPSGPGNYFAHFADQGSGVRGLIFASTNGAAPGKLRVGVTRSADAVNQAAFLPVDLAPNTPYTIVTRHFLAGGFTTLWVNPVSELDPRVDSNDPPSSLSLWTYAFREGKTGEAGMGGILIDSLRVGRTFGDATDFPLQLIVVGHADGGIDMVFQTLKDRVYRIEIADELSVPEWRTLHDNLNGAGSTLLIHDSPGDANRYYRLVLLPLAGGL